MLFQCLIDRRYSINRIFSIGSQNIFVSYKAMKNKKMLKIDCVIKISFRERGVHNSMLSSVIFHCVIYFRVTVNKNIILPKSSYYKTPHNLFVHPRQYLLLRSWNWFLLLSTSPQDSSLQLLTLAYWWTRSRPVKMKLKKG